MVSIQVCTRELLFKNESETYGELTDILYFLIDNHIDCLVSNLPDLGIVISIKSKLSKEAWIKVIQEIFSYYLAPETEEDDNEEEDE